MQKKVPAVQTAALLAFLFAASATAAQNVAPSWSETECLRYAAAWSEVLERRGVEGVGKDFHDRHVTFLASGCNTEADVCPRAPAELEMANVMVVDATNAGMASTFQPFACK